MMQNRSDVERERLDHRIGVDNALPPAGVVESRSNLPNQESEHLRKRTCHCDRSAPADCSDEPPRKKRKASTTARDLMRAVKRFHESYRLSAPQRYREQLRMLHPADLFNLSERFLECREQFQLRGKPSHVSIGYHYVADEESLFAMQADGLQPTRDITGATGIRVANSPHVGHSKGAMGVLVAMIRGNGQRVQKIGPARRRASIDTILVGRGHDRRRKGWDQAVLLQSYQCLPLVCFPATLIDDLHVNSESNGLVQKMQEGLESVMDALLNEDYEARTPEEDLERCPTPPLTSLSPSSSWDMPLFEMNTSRSTRPCPGTPDCGSSVVTFSQDACLDAPLLLGEDQSAPQPFLSLRLPDNQVGNRLLARLHFAWRMGSFPNHTTSCLNLQGSNDGSPESQEALVQTLDALGVPCALQCVYKSPRVTFEEDESWEEIWM